MDRISGLPGDVIGIIVSFLPANDAARVLLLARSFRHLYTIIPNLEFNDALEFQGTFTDFVTQSLARLQTTTLIRRFSLKYKRDKLVDSDRINHWLRDVLKRSVMDLELDISGGDNRYELPLDGYELPLEIFTCNTLTKMKLGEEFVIRALPKDALLPSLESLILESVRFYARDDNGDCAFHAFLLACPVLKELKIDGMYWENWKWSRIVSSQSLQRLTIGRTLSEGYYEPSSQSISFNTPNLAFFQCGDFVPDSYPTVNFDSLVEAKLNLWVMVDRLWHAEFANDDDVLSSNPTNLIQGLRNVKILDLTSPVMLETLYFFRNAIPVFKNLHRLSFQHDDWGVCWRVLPYLLDKTPNLKTLVIEGGLHYVEEPDYVCHCLLGYSFLLSCRVEVMEITLWEHGTIEELEQVKHFLGKLPCLKLLIVNTSRWASDNEKLRIIKDLRRLPRASPKCRVEFRCIV
ncbi:F-box/LRR-repeat protein [Cardamine amara subsp. amara]|uniref:F-box/LRR-repeat protein n=1 Tax=Cardamine amara subsp. amara TaxID=228776 RepID=A0ABD1BY02_CARAN